MDGPIDPALHEHYARGEERDRLTEARGMLEFERTTEIVLRQLPAPPSVVADIGGDPGRYELWLAERGHRVEHRDLMPLHVDQLCAVADPSRITTAVGDARDLDLDNSVAEITASPTLCCCWGRSTTSAAATSGCARFARRGG